MSVSIRLKKMGKKDQPFYRLVAAETLMKREGTYIENLGWYNPMAEGENYKIAVDRVDYWLSKGARISDTAKNLLSRARKHQAPAAVEAAPAAEEAPAASETEAASES